MAGRGRASAASDGTGPRTGAAAVLDGTPYLQDSCPHLYVPFTAHHFRRASVIWLNERYWCERGLDLGDTAVAGDLAHQLLARFGASTIGDFDDDDTYLVTAVTLHADRYGGTFGHSHGGSGRAGTAGPFNAKGVGATPLCDPDANWYHSHGCMWLEEAVREAIFSEVCWRAFPWRSNPVVAIIDTGENVREADGTVGARRAIAVRPAALRVSHLERNILFGTAGTPDSDQYLDFLRTGEVIGHVRQVGLSALGGAGAAGAHGADAGGDTTLLATVMARICSQAGFGRAHRLFHGDYLSSNICITGALVDFGAFRGVEDWRRLTWEENALPFGGEGRRLFQTGRSLAFHLRKHGGPPDGDRPVPLNTLEAMIDAAFRAALEGICAPHPAGTRIAARLADFFAHEQARPADGLAGWTALRAGFVGEAVHPRGPFAAGNDADFAHRLGRAIAADLAVDGDGAAAVAARARFIRWATPFDRATRAAVLDATAAAIARWPEGRIRAARPNISSLVDTVPIADPPAAWLAAHIAAAIHRIGRSCRPLPASEVIEHEATIARCLVLACRDVATGARYWRVEGPGTGGTLLANGRPHPLPTGSRAYNAGPGLVGYITDSPPSFVGAS